VGFHFQIATMLNAVITYSWMHKFFVVSGVGVNETDHLWLAVTC
jgi:hypothetical protein